MKKVYKDNYSNIKISFYSLTDKKIAEINDRDAIKEMFELMKNEKIRPITTFEYDYINSSKSYNMVISSDLYEFRLILSREGITINYRMYFTTTDFTKFLPAGFEQYSIH